MSHDTLAIISGLFSLVASVVLFINNMGKTDKATTAALEKTVAAQKIKLDQQERIIADLHKNDLSLQRVLNDKEKAIQEILYEIRAEEDNVIQNEIDIERKYPELEQTLATIIHAQNTMFEKLQKIEEVIKV